MGQEANTSKSGCQQFLCWPAIIYAIVSIIVLLGILFSSIDSSTKAWSFFVTLIWSIIWVAILYFFCVSGFHAIAWFLVLLPVAVSIFWYISCFIAKATVPERCVSGGIANASPLM